MDDKDIFSNKGDYDNSYDLYYATSGYTVKRAKRLRKILNVLISVVLTLSFLITAALGGYLIISNDNVGSLKTGDDQKDAYGNLYTSKNENVTYMLVTGVDLSERLTDIIVVVCFDHAKNTISCLQVPRDTFAGDDVKSYRINTVYGAARENETGINALRRKLASYLGVPIDHYVIFTIKGFMNVVDAVGGVEINITQKEGISIEDQNHIGTLYNIGPGWVTLDGNAAAGFVRKRHGGEEGYRKGDISRLEAQRLMYVALVKKLKSMGIGTMAGVAKSCYDQIATDMTVDQIVGYAKAAKGVEYENFSVYTVPGQGCTYKKRSLYSIHKADYVALYNNYFNPYGEKITEQSIEAVELHKRLGQTEQKSLAADGGSLRSIIDNKHQ